MKPAEFRIAARPTCRPSGSSAHARFRRSFPARRCSRATGRDMRTLAMAWSCSVFTSSNSAFTVTTSVFCGSLPRSCNCMETSANISGVVYSRMSSRSLRSLAACRRMNEVFALRRKLSTGKSAGMLAGRHGGGGHAAVMAAAPVLPRRHKARPIRRTASQVLACGGTSRSRTSPPPRPG